MAVSQHYFGATEGAAGAVHGGKRAGASGNDAGGRGTGDRVGALCHRGRGAGAEPPDAHGLHPLPRQSPLDKPRVSGAISRLRARAGEHGMGQPVRRRQHGQDGFL